MRRSMAVILAAVTTLGAAQATPGDRLDLERRALVASQIYASVLVHFGHWRGIPGFDLDQAYRGYLHQVLANDDRRAFDLATMEFLARLHNGHSGFDDRWLRERFGQRLGFYAYPIDGRWTITATSISGLEVGDVIRSIDGRDFEDFYRENQRYVSASDERWARRSFFEHSYLFPPSFTLGLEDGRKVRVTRAGEFQWPGEEHKAIEVRREGGVAYLRIPSFGRPVFEQAAVETLKTLGAVRAVILDLRGNHGGSTPVDLVRALMDRPWRWSAEATPMRIGTAEIQEDPSSHMELYDYGLAEQPVGKPYGGPLYLLVDGGCFSACEDLLLTFKDNHRAVIVGERTAGSSGQPYGRDLGDGMGLGLSTKRMFTPDGGAFEGVGVAPDVEVHATIEDLKAGRDPVLARARALIAAGR